MKKVKALVAFSNGVISMEQYEVRELPTATADALIADGVCVEISGGGSGGGVLVVTSTEGTLDKTWQEIHDAFPNVYIDEDGTIHAILTIFGDSDEYGVIMADGNAVATFVATSASGYPTGQ